MLHPMNLDLMRAQARHHPDGHPIDAHEHHRREHIAQRRMVRRQRFVMILRVMLQVFRVSALQGHSTTSTVAQVSKQTPPASAITPIVARPPRPRSGPNTSTSRSDRPDDTLCTSS